MGRWRERFSTRFRHLKATERLTQQALADRLGVAQSTVAGWLHGRREPESLQQYVALARELRVHPAWLLFGVEIDEESTKVAMAISQLPERERALVTGMVDSLRNAG